MASGSKRRNQQAQQSYAFNQQVQQQQLQPSAGETALEKNATDVLNYKGPAEGTPGLIMPTFYSRLKSEQAQQNRGAQTFGAQMADPNLLAGLGAQQENQASQLDALAFQDAVSSRRAEALGSAGQSAALRNARLGGLGAQSSNAAQFYAHEANQPGFWTNFLFAAMNNAARVAAAGAGGGG